MMDNSSATTNTNIHVNNDEMASTDPDSMEASRFDAKPVTGPSTARSTGSSTTNSECVQGDKEDESSGGGPKRQRRIKTEDPPTKDDETTEDKAVASAVPAKSSFRKEEDDQFVEKLLLQLEEEIQKLRSHRNAYDRARFLSPARIRSPALRLMFLRAEEYDARKAARRIVAFFEAKRKLFGDEKLTKTITLDDLDLRDQEALLTESIQVLPCTDTAGRVVLFVAAYYFKFKSWENQLRAAWYVLMSALEDDIVQRRGIVCVVYNVASVSGRASGIAGVAAGGGEFLDLNMMTRYQLRDALPLRVSHVHYCHRGEDFHPFASLLRQLLGNNPACQLLDHDGPHTECQAALDAAGIAPGIIPLNTNGILTREDFARWLGRQKEKEALWKEQEEKSDRIVVARNNDVLSGRGRPYQDHPGNEILARLIDKYRDEYNAVERFRKTCISWEIVNQIRDMNGRFLQKDEANDTWVIVNDIDCREKVARGFRRKTAGQLL